MELGDIQYDSMVQQPLTITNTGQVALDFSIAVSQCPPQCKIALRGDRGSIGPGTSIAVTVEVREGPRTRYSDGTLIVHDFPDMQKGYDL